MEFVGCGWGGDWFGEFGWVDGDGAVQAFAGYVAGVEEAAGEVGDGDVFDFDVLHVREEDAFGAGAGDAGEREAVEGIVIVLLSTTRIPLPWLYRQLWPSGIWPFWIGAAVTVVGLLFAVWARQHLGSNWSHAVTVKQGHELITTGPYALVRHPIYTGILTGFLGTAIALSQVRGVIGFVLIFLVLWAKLRTEEEWMRSQFGETYATYAHQTAALVPYLF